MSPRENPLAPARGLWIHLSAAITSWIVVGLIVWLVIQ